MFKSAGQSSVDCPALLFSVYFHLVFIPIKLFSPCVPSPMSILICPVTCYSLASRSFWTFLLLFCALCPFSPARFRISLWLPDVFGHFYCFSQLYVHFLLLGSVLPSGFRRILDFFPVFLGFMSIFSCLVPCYSLASCSFWTFLLLFCALCPFSPARFRISLWFPENFGLFSCFSRLYVHFHLLGSVFLSGFSENFGLFSCFSRPYVHFHLLGSVFLSGFRMILDFSLVFLSFISIWKSIEESGILDHSLFVPKTAFPTAISKTGRM